MPSLELSRLLDYHRQMRSITSTLLLALMIIMLPLRGWMGGLMAIEMASQHLTQASASSNAAEYATYSIAPRVNSTVVSSHLTQINVATKAPAMPCHSMAGDDAQGVEKVTLQADNTSAKTTCTSCQFCHLSALTVDSVTSVSVNTAHSALAFAPQYWASAELPQVTKPPVF